MNTPRPNIDELAAEVHILNDKWWRDLNTGEPIKRNKSELCMLIISEFSEAMEGERKNLMDDKLPHRKMAEVECADATIRILDLMGAFKFRFVTEPKGRYNFEGLKSVTNRAEYLYNLCAILTQPLNFATMHDCFSFLILAIESYCEKFGYDLWAAVAEKLEYNKTRIDHSEEHRKQAGGKKW